MLGGGAVGGVARKAVIKYLCKSSEKAISELGASSKMALERLLERDIHRVMRTVT